jgi:hypothetical protein
MAHPAALESECRRRSRLHERQGAHPGEWAHRVARKCKEQEGRGSALAHCGRIISRNVDPKLDKKNKLPALARLGALISSMAGSHITGHLSI